MVGLICIGLMGLAGVIAVTFNRQAQEAAVELPTPTAIPLTFTPTSTVSPTPTETPLPTPTGTPVVGGGGDEQEAAAAPDEAEPPEEASPDDLEVTPTNTLVLQTPTETATPAVTATPTLLADVQIPASGGVLPAKGNGFLAWAGVVLLLLLILGAVHHLRSLTPNSRE